MEKFVTLTLLVTNGILALGAGIPLARYLAREVSGGGKTVLWLLALAGIYFVECVAFSASMATNVFGFALAIVWGFVFRRKLAALPLGKAVKAAWRVSIFTGLPAISFLSILVLAVAEGGDILSVREGWQFGIPDFVPWPLCTLLGFFLAVSGSAVVFKTLITTGIVAIASRGSHDLDTPPGVE